MSRLKLVTTEVPTSNNILFIDSSEPGNPRLAYKKSAGVIQYLDKGGSPRSRLIKCSQLDELLSANLIKGTKFIASTYNPTLYYMFPGNPSNDALFNTNNNFIPTFKTSDYIRNEVDGFDKDGFNDDPEITQNAVRSMKACDSWYNNPTELETIITAIDDRIDTVFGAYREEFDPEKEVKEKTGWYSADVSSESLVVSLLSGTSYTDTLNLEDWIYKSGKDGKGISGKLDISYLYSIGSKVYGGMQTIKAFQYEEDITVKDAIIDLGKVQIEYIGRILKIYPLSDDVGEAIFNDCTLTIGVL